MKAMVHLEVLILAYIYIYIYEADDQDNCVWYIYEV